VKESFFSSETKARRGLGQKKEKCGHHTDANMQRRKKGEKGGDNDPKSRGQGGEKSSNKHR